MKFVFAVATLLVTWLIVRLVLKRYLQYRRRTQSGQEFQQYKAKLPSWLKLTEMLLWVALWLPLMFALITLLTGAHMAVRPAQKQPDSIAMGLIALSSAVTTLVPAMLLANLISWLLPPLRKANLAIMHEFATVSYQSATMGLVKFGAVMIPVSLGVAVLAVFAPWAN